MFILVDLLDFGILCYWTHYWIHSDCLLLTVSTLLSLHEFFPSAIIMCFEHFVCRLKESVCLTSQLLCVLTSLMGPLICPLLLLANFGNSVVVKTIKGSSG